MVLLPASVGLTKYLADWRLLSDMLRQRGILFATITETGRIVTVDSLEDEHIQEPINRGLEWRRGLAATHHQRNIELYEGVVCIE